MEHWAKITMRFDEWGSPLRPSLEDVALIKSGIDQGAKTLLLGATVELMPFVDATIDQNPDVLQLHRGNLVLGDWGALTFERDFDAIIGDG